MRYILNKFESVKNNFSVHLTKEQCIKIALGLVRISSMIYLGFLSFQYISTAIDYIYNQNPVYYVDFKLTDYFWFISVKLIICALYFSIFFFSKALDLSDTLFHFEIKFILVFAVADLAWQVLEMVDYWAANNGTLQLALTLLAVAAFLNLLFFRLVYHKSKKDEKE